jgi:iron complex transport system substrate-binding protein
MASIADVLEAERTIGAALGAAGKGDALAKALSTHLAETTDRMKGLPRPRVLLVYGWDPLVVAGPGSFADELLAAIGAENAAGAAKSAYATYSVEAAATSHPQVIVDATFDQPMPALFKTLPGLSTARVVKPASLALLHPGPSLSRGLDELAQAVHPELRPKP